MQPISLVYVAGPLTHHDQVQEVMNVEVAKEAGHILEDAGLSAFVPHYFYHSRRRVRRSYEEWMAIDLRMLRNCHALVRLPGPSPGADREVEAAKVLGMPVYFGIEACVAELSVIERSL